MHFLHKTHPSLLALGDTRQLFSSMLGGHSKQQNCQPKSQKCEKRGTKQTTKGTLVDSLSWTKSVLL